MASVEGLPLPLLLDSLLASSWTWLALSLATIATLLRALSRLSLCRHRPQALLAPSVVPGLLLSAETKQIASVISNLPLPLRKSHKRRSSCKSTPSLQGLPFCFGSVDSSPPPRRLRRTASSSEISRAPVVFERVGSVQKPCISDPVAESKLGFLVDSEQESVSEAAAQGFGEKRRLLYRSSTLPRSLSETTPLFETQFGWKQLLDMKLGSQWAVQTRPLYAAPAATGVKLWSIHERNLLRALNIDQMLVGALDADVRDCLACISLNNGDISLWDIVSQACLSRVIHGGKQVSTLCWRRDLRLAVAASCGSIEFWDFRSPNLVPIWKWNAVLDDYQFAHCCEGNIHGIYQGNNAFLLCDLRKAHVDSVTDTNLVPLSAPIRRMETMQTLLLSDKPSVNDEEWWDDSGVAGCVAPDTSNVSFTSRCVTLVRSLSSSGRS